MDRLYFEIDRRLKGWLTVLLRTAVAFDKDDGATKSRSIAYYALFSIFPLLLLILILSNSLLELKETQRVIFEVIEQYMPAAVDIVEGNINAALEAESTIGVLALIGLLWSASGVFTAIYRAVNRAWGNPKSELFWTEKLYGLAVVLVVGLLLVATTLYSTVVSLVQSWQVTGWEPLAGPGATKLLGRLSTLVPALVSVLTFTILYRTIPRNGVTWRDVWLGGLIAGLIWEVVRRGFTWYLANFARYSLIYGSVGAIIAFLLWCYLSAMIVLLGAEFAAQYTHWRQAGRPLEDRPPGQWMSDWTRWMNP